MNTPSTDPKKAMGITKPQLQLIPPALNVELAAALQNGIDKGYGPFNWRTGSVEMMTYLGAMKRHIDDILNGEDIATDSGVTHLGHIAANCAILLDAKKHGTLVDNRPPAAVMKKQLQEAEETMAQITGACPVCNGRGHVAAGHMNLQSVPCLRCSVPKSAPTCYGTFHDSAKYKLDCSKCNFSTSCAAVPPAPPADMYDNTIG